MDKLFAPCKKIWILESGEFLLVESEFRENFAYEIWNPGFLESGIQVKGSRILLTIEIQNPSSTD